MKALMKFPDYSKITRGKVFSPVFSTSLVRVNLLSASDNSLDIYYHYFTLLMVNIVKNGENRKNTGRGILGKKL